ncbi:hypothetical protein HHI36_006148 [Cryptolaemus montrouzieri]|uniref:Uncharacterized protein n=1 Tax=Cryptolaemus montrouzieri TaxID=559131 RepID=A0ABD2NW83_9CUCU
MQERMTEIMNNLLQYEAETTNIRFKLGELKRKVETKLAEKRAKKINISCSMKNNSTQTESVSEVRHNTLHVEQLRVNAFMNNSTQTDFKEEKRLYERLKNDLSTHIEERIQFDA